MSPTEWRVLYHVRGQPLLQDCRGNAFSRIVAHNMEHDSGNHPKMSAPSIRRTSASSTYHEAVMEFGSARSVGPYGSRSGYVYHCRTACCSIARSGTARHVCLLRSQRPSYDNLPCEYGLFGTSPYVFWLHPGECWHGSQFRRVDVARQHPICKQPPRQDRFGKPGPCARPASIGM